MTLEQAIHTYRNSLHGLFRACRYSRAETESLMRETFRRAALKTQTTTSLKVSEIEEIVRDLLCESPRNPLASFVATTPAFLSLSLRLSADSIGELEPSVRDAMMQHYAHGASSSELSQRMRRSPRAVKQLLTRGRDGVAAGLG